MTQKIFLGPIKEGSISHSTLSQLQNAERYVAQFGCVVERIAFDCVVGRIDFEIVVGRIS